MRVLAAIAGCRERNAEGARRLEKDFEEALIPTQSALTLLSAHRLQRRLGSVAVKAQPAKRVTDENELCPLLPFRKDVSAIPDLSHDQLDGSNVVRVAIAFIHCLENRTCIARGCLKLLQSTGNHRLFNGS